MRKAGTRLKIPEGHKTNENTSAMLVLTTPEFPVVRKRDWSITSLQST
jgi:hypothetical protein